MNSMEYINPCPGCKSSKIEKSGSCKLYCTKCGHSIFYEYDPECNGYRRGEGMVEPIDVIINAWNKRCRQESSLQYWGRYEPEGWQSHEERVMNDPHFNLPRKLKTFYVRDPVHSLCLDPKMAQARVEVKYGEIIISTPINSPGVYWANESFIKKLKGVKINLLQGGTK